MRHATAADVLTLRAQGLGPAAITRALNVAGPTVDYHLARLGAGSNDPERTDPAIVDGGQGGDTVARQPTTRERVRRLLDEGLSRAEMARRIGVTKSTISYHMRTLGQPVDERCARRYDWSEIRAFYDAGHTFRECQARFGFNAASWHDAVRRGDIRPRPAAMPIGELLQQGVPRCRNHVKSPADRRWPQGKRVRALRDRRMARGAPLSIALHHVNGERHDNRLENLELLCPNCHSQTENFSGRNGRRPKSG